MNRILAVLLFAGFTVPPVFALNTINFDIGHDLHVIKLTATDIDVPLPTPPVVPAQSKSEENDLALNNTYKTQHFVFYFSEDKGALENVFTTLENNYPRIIKSFKANLVNKLQVEIYPDIASYHKRTGATEDWMVGNYDSNDKTLRMVSPNHPGSVHNYHSIILVAVHEFVHYVTFEYSQHENEMPIWLSEGLAVYYSNQFDEDKKSIETLIALNQIPTLYSLENDFPNNNGYTFSGSVIDFIIKKFGEEKLMEFVKEPISYEKVFSMSKKDLSEKWQQYLKEEYKK